MFTFSGIVDECKPLVAAATAAEDTAKTSFADIFTDMLTDDILNGDASPATAGPGFGLASVCAFGSLPSLDRIDMYHWQPYFHTHRNVSKCPPTAPPTKGAPQLAPTGRIWYIAPLRRALTLCMQLCMGIQSGACFAASSADALSAILYWPFTQAIYRIGLFADD